MLQYIMLALFSVKLYTVRSSIVVMIIYVCISMYEVMWLFKLYILCCVLRVCLEWYSCILPLCQLLQFVACTQGVGYANVISSLSHVMAACMLLVLVLHLRWYVWNRCRDAITLRGSPCQERVPNALHDGERWGGRKGGAQAIRPARTHC